MCSMVEECALVRSTTLFEEGMYLPDLRGNDRETNSHVDSVTPFCSMILLCQRSPHITTPFTAVKRLGIRVNTRVIYALPVTFPPHPTKFPRSNSASRAISVLSSNILALQTFSSRVFLLRQQPF